MYWIMWEGVRRLEECGFKVRKPEMSSSWGKIVCFIGYTLCL